MVTPHIAYGMRVTKRSLPGAVITTSAPSPPVAAAATAADLLNPNLALSRSDAMKSGDSATGGGGGGSSGFEYVSTGRGTEGAPIEIDYGTDASTVAAAAALAAVGNGGLSKYGRGVASLPSTASGRRMPGRISPRSGRISPRSPRLPRSPRSPRSPGSDVAVGGEWDKGVGVKRHRVADESSATRGRAVEVGGAGGGGGGERGRDAGGRANDKFSVDPPVVGGGGVRGRLGSGGAEMGGLAAGGGRGRGSETPSGVPRLYRHDSSSGSSAVEAFEDVVDGQVEEEYDEVRICTF